MTFKKSYAIIKATKEKDHLKERGTHMRLVHYIVEKTDKTQFETTSYAVATKDGNHIIKTFLTNVDETTDKQKDEQKAHRAKVHEVLQKKRDV